VALWPQAEAEAATTLDGGPQLLGMLHSLNPGVLARLSRDGAVASFALRVQTAAGASRLPSSGPPISLDVGVRNVADRRYWRDSGQAYSADLLFPGAARAVSVALNVVGFG